MKKQEQLRIIFISYVISIVTPQLINLLRTVLENSVDFTLTEFNVGSIQISTILTVWWGFYFIIGWRIPLLNYILKKKCVNGSYYGEYSSRNIKTDEKNKGKIALAIKQDYLNIKLFSYTNKSKNYSYSEVIRYDDISDLHEIIYTYEQKGSIEFGVRKGTAEIEVLDIDKEIELHGYFWTSHETVGNMKLRKVSNSRKNSFAEIERLANNKKMSIDFNL